MTAFHELYEKYARDVYRFALYLSGDPVLAEDVTSETFIRVWCSPEPVRLATVKAYLLTIARNLYRDELRSSRQTRDREVELEDTIADATPGAEIHAQHASTLRNVRAKLRGIARGDRRALLLYVLKEMSYAEVAAKLGISIGAVKSRINRAREALAASMQRLENGEGR